MKTDNTNNPKFSIVIPTYNTQVVLDECLSALCHQRQNSELFEVIIVNDGGNNITSNIVNRYKDELIILYFYQDNKGPAAARNLGIRYAKGDIVLFLDDDSLPTRNWLEAVIKAWNKFPDFDGIGGYTISEITDSIYCRVNSDFFNWYLDQYSKDTLHPFLVTCNAGYRKTILNKVDRFDERFKKASGEDRDLNVKISKIGGKLRLDKDILVYHDRDLTFLSLLKKHFNYGKAAHKIYKRYPELNYLSSKAYINLYASILKKYRSLKEKAMAALLISLSQLCTIIGYYWGIISK